MTAAVIYPLLCTALFYLSSQAEITRWLWSRYPERLDAFLSCPACSGFWWGLGCASLGWWQRWPFLGLEPRGWITLPVVALCAIVWTPLLVRLHARSMTNDADENT